MGRLLLVEDYPIAREPLARLLRYEGYQVQCAANGIEALEVLERCVPDLILLDLVMPKMNGTAVLDSIRRDPRLREIPVIAVTGSQDSAQLAALHSHQVRAVFRKASFDVDALLEEIARSVPCGGELQRGQLQRG